MKTTKDIELDIILKEMKVKIKENEKKISKIDKVKFVEYFNNHGLDNFTVSLPNINI